MAVDRRHHRTRKCSQTQKHRRQLGDEFFGVALTLFQQAVEIDARRKDRAGAGEHNRFALTVILQAREVLSQCAQQFDIDSIRLAMRQAQDGDRIAVFSLDHLASLLVFGLLKVTRN